MTTDILPPLVRVHVVPSPLALDRRSVAVPTGYTVRDFVTATQLAPEGLRVLIDGEEVPVERWDGEIPGAGASVLIARRPGAPLAAAALAAFAEGAIVTGVLYTVAYIAVTLAIGYGISLIANALFGAGTPDTPESVAGVRRTISGSRNTLTPYAPLPQVLGEHRIFPPLAAASYTTVEDGKLYQYALFTCGHGPLVLSSFKIGDEPLFSADYTIAYTGQLKANTDAFGGTLRTTAAGQQTRYEGDIVTIEARQGGSSDAAITLFAKDVQDQIVGLPLVRSKGWIVRRTLDRATNITVIIGAPGGMVYINDAGNAREAAVQHEIEYRSATSTGAWTALSKLRMAGKTRSSVYASRSWAVTEGTYDVRVKRVTPDSAETGQAGVTDSTTWVSMLATRAGNPVVQTGLCLIAVRFKITGNFPGLVDQFNVVAQTVCPDWNAGTSTWITRATSNPASLYRHVLQGAANKRAVADAEIDLVGLAAWHVENATKGFGFNYVTQGRQTVLKMLQNIAAAGRASFGYVDGKFTAVREPNTSTASAAFHFGPRNSRNFKGRRRYPTPVQALKFQFVDPASGYLDTERIVPDDGYTVASATTFERVDMPGITSSDQAYKLGRYYLAQARLRPEEYEIDVDFENLNVVRGDWGYVTHDVPLLGLANGRILSVTLNGAGAATSIEVDQECTMVSGTYGVRVRKSTGVSVQRDLTTVVGDQTTLTFATPIPSGDPQPVAGDWFAFGVSGSETAKMVVKEIRPGDNLTATVVLVDLAPGVLTADTGTIPAYTPQITLPPAVQAASKKLMPPRVAAVTSSDTRSTEGRGPVISRGLVVRLSPSGTST